jgi:Cytochrome P450
MATLTFAVYCLSQHRNVLMNLREEILTKVGHNRAPTFDNVKDCRYLRAVINGTSVDYYGDVFTDLLWRSQRRFVYTQLCMYRSLFPPSSRNLDVSHVPFLDHSIRGMCWRQDDF